MEREIDRQLIGAASRSCIGVYRTVVVKKELSRKAKLSIYRSISFPPSPMVMNFGRLLLRIERSQLRWLGHLFRMPPGRLPREAGVPGVSHREKALWKTQDTLETMSLGWPGHALGSPEELEEVSGVREVWASLLRLLPPRPGPGPSG
ncbi:hypothetical protein L3Q82_016902 [Scortum barcoo]|uniref:Uncharacterized protein n=1 Tax=Scortum barcoo TaxID=214431 RepID=A0ACB8X8T0_9TELE|nr:hypothetical protein L3Q82_016902 [Scortum barcoo]